MRRGYTRACVCVCVCVFRSLTLRNDSNMQQVNVCLPDVSSLICFLYKHVIEVKVLQL